MWLGDWLRRKGRLQKQGARSPRVGVIHLRVRKPCRLLEGGAIGSKSVVNSDQHGTDSQPKSFTGAVFIRGPHSGQDMKLGEEPGGKAAS